MAELIIPFALVAVVLMLSGLVSGVVREAPSSGAEVGTSSTG